MNNHKLSDKVALVTGASSGIGSAIAIELAKEGARVVINYRSDEKGAEATLSKVKEAGSEGYIVQADVSKEEDVSKMFDAARNQFGTIDILVNNAGIQQDDAMVEMSLTEWQRVIDVNLTGYFLCSRQAIKEFLKRECDAASKAIGKIICVSSVHDIIPWAGHVNYAASKGGVLMFTKSLALEVASKKIRVNAISPGAIKTDINAEVWSDPQKAQELLKLIPYKRIGDPEDVGKVAAWLASDDSDYVTGTTIYVDGGMTLYPGFVDNG
ncbi:SDR family oxidoreductase [Chitinophagaceae bacterium LB-8]|uniref:SDR family oxidoreductase n=1 Tax=Paraflavisolibacter caeni TaxID=2982496 RepID=A0A9X3BA99_9BACT|nr:SDR family oxidoreductase [Paraflavisolibacter caeni]MCU7552411.1 SDR family oxidoreductase [Paraflavisolibacter caeni]